MSDAGLEQQRFDSACHRQMSGDLRGARSDFLALAADLAGRYPAVSAQHDTGDICDDIDFSLAAILLFSMFYFAFYFRIKGASRHWFGKIPEKKNANKDKTNPPTKNQN